MSLARSVLLGSIFLLGSSAMVLAQETVRLQRVMLSAGGVGYLDFAAKVDPRSRIELGLPRGQADDILKSLTIYSDSGKLGAVTIAGEMAPAELFRDLPIAEADLTRPAALLTRLKGARIRVDGPRVISGRLLAIEKEEIRTEHGVTAVHRVSVMTAEGLRSFILEEVTGVRFEEPQTNAMIETALGRLAATRAEGDRSVQISLDAAAGSDVRLGYLIEAPLWKTSYRAVLTPERARLQAWAIVDNRSGIDWKDIELTLVSGSPVTLRQALSKVYFVDRPDVPIRLAESLRPRVDQGQTAMRQEAPKRAAARSMAMAPQNELEAVAMASQPAPPPTADMAAIEAPQQVEGTTQTTYRLPGAVTLPNGSTAMLPLLDRQLSTERVAVFQPDRQRSSPLAALRVKNDGEVSLPRGILTIYETDELGRVAFEGDAELDGLPPGETRLLPYALDAKTRIRVERENAQRLSGYKLVDGVLTIASVDRASQRYIAEAPQRESRILVIEHPKMPGFALTAPEAQSETDRFWRFERPLAAGSSLDLEVVMERQRSTEMMLLDASLDELRLAFHGRDLPAALQEAMARIATLGAEVAEAEADVARSERDRGALVEEQARLRANFGSVPKDSDLAKRYLDRLASTEDGLETLARALPEARERVRLRRDALEGFVRSLRL